MSFHGETYWMPKYFDQVSTAVDEVWSHLGKEIRLATPLGLGKPNFFLNELYARAKANPNLNLKFYTALSLAPPESGSNELAKRFLNPFAERMWGKDYPVLDYSRDAEKNRLPKNVSVHEFYFRAGSALGSNGMQGDYQSINYTHVAEAVYNDDIQLIVQMVARNADSSVKKLSLGCNPDVTLDLIDLYKASGKKVLRVAVIHPD
ncbi:MAG: acetyl-CoA hydrolase, partial [Proteobacteria bacterium]